MPSVRFAAFLLFVAVGASAQETKAPPKPEEPWRAALNEAQEAMRGKRHDDALALLDRTIELHPRVERLHSFRSFVRLQAGALDGALADANQAIELLPRFGYLYLLRADVHIARKDTDAAAADLDAAIARSPKLERAWGLRGEIRAGRKDFAGARSDLERAIELDPDMIGGHAALAHTCLVLGDLAVAQAEIRRATRRVPDNAEFWSLRAAVEFAGLDDAAAEQCFERAMALQPAGDRRSEILCDRADCRAVVGRWHEAIADATTATEGAATDAARQRAWQRVGCHRIAIGDRDGAAAAFASAQSAPDMAPWAAAMRWTLAPAETAAAADDALRQAFAAVPKPEAIAVEVRDICLGERAVDPNDALAGRSNDDQCAIWFFAGCRARRDGLADVAETMFRRSVNTGCWISRQWYVALALLIRGREPAPAPAFDVRLTPADKAAGVVVQSLAPFGAGSLQGLRVGDRITEIAGVPALATTLAETLQRVRPGRHVAFTWVRAGKKMTRSLVAGVATE